MEDLAKRMDRFANELKNRRLATDDFGYKSELAAAEDAWISAAKMVRAYASMRLPKKPPAPTHDRLRDLFLCDIYDAV